MMRVFVAVVTSLLLCLVTNGQENRAAILHQPTAQEYLFTASDIFRELDQTTLSSQDQYALRILITDELQRAYDKESLSEVSFDILNTITSNLRLDVGFDYEPYSIPGWHNIVFNAWLRETQPDLRTQSQWQFGPYTLLVDLVDFTGDGIDDYSVALSYQPGEWVEFTEYFVLQKDKRLPEGYRRLGENLNEWFSVGCNQLSCGGQGEVYRIQDINGDDVPEWIFSRGSCGWGHCAIWMQVFSYIDGDFVDVFDSQRPSIEIVSGGGGVPSSPNEGIWTFQNIDDDPATEIIQHETIEDNRGCVFSTSKIFDWNAQTKQFASNEPEYQYKDSAWCALRQAHNAMKVLDIESAIQSYVHFLEFESVEEAKDIWFYARLRLALAYALIGNRDKAREMITSIDVGQIYDDSIRAFIETSQNVYMADSNPVSFCVAVNKAVQALGQSLGNPLLQNYLENNDYGVSWNYGGGDFGPATVGCNYDSLLDLAIEKLNSNLSIDEQFSKKDWIITSQFGFNLDPDRLDETIRWVQSGDAIYSWNDNSGSHVARVYFGIDSPSEYSSFNVITLSDGKPILVNITFDSSTRCQPDTPDYPGEITLLTASKDGLSQIDWMIICEPQTLEQTFPNSDELHILEDYYGESKVYIWDSEQSNFTLLSSHVEPQETSSKSAKDYLSCDFTVYGLCSNLDKPDELISIVNAVLASPDLDKSLNFEYGLIYLRALAHESIGDESEALADYLSVYETAQGTPWATLAQLHFNLVP